MVFNSFHFLFKFLPLFLAVYYVSPKQYRSLALCASSLVFYIIGVWSKPWCVVLLLGLTALAIGWTYLLKRGTGSRKGLLALGIVLLAAPLAWYKYAGLFLGETPSLPLGLSFYTFQLIAFVVECYKTGAADPISIIAGTMAFPKVLSGPLVVPASMDEQLKKPAFSLKNFNAGIQDFILGLAMKVIVADRLSGFWGQIRTWGYESISTPLAWLGLVAYGLQLYFDFYGYSRMAFGLGKMMGLTLPVNFNHPYAARSIGDFWRRWHISLGVWFRTYIYIPLGGSRNGTFKMVVSTLAVWLLTGIWHGAGWNYVIWGLWMFALIMGERMIYGKRLAQSGALAHVYVLLAVGLSWLLFAVEDMGAVGTYLLRMFGGGGVMVQSGDWIEMLNKYWFYLLLGIVLSTPIPRRLWVKKISRMPVAPLLMFCLFWICVYFLATSASDPFMYFSF